MISHLYHSSLKNLNLGSYVGCMKLRGCSRVLRLTGIVKSSANKHEPRMKCLRTFHEIYLYQPAIYRNKFMIFGFTSMMAFLHVNFPSVCCKLRNFLVLFTSHLVYNCCMFSLYHLFLLRRFSLSTPKYLSHLFIYIN